MDSSDSIILRASTYGIDSQWRVQCGNGVSYKNSAMQHNNTKLLLLCSGSHLVSIHSIWRFSLLVPYRIGSASPSLSEIKHSIVNEQNQSFHRQLFYYLLCAQYDGGAYAIVPSKNEKKANVYLSYYMDPK